MKNFAKSKGKRITAVLLCAVMCIMSLPLSAFAFTAEEGKTVNAYYGDKYVSADGEMYYSPSTYQYIAYDANGNESLHTQSAGNSRTKLMIKDSSGSRQIMCIESGIPYNAGGTYDSKSGTNSSYFQNLPTTAQYGIMLTSVYGWRPGKTAPISGTNEDDFSMATQIILWEYQQQLRTSPTTLKANSYGVPADTYFKGIKGRPAEKCYNWLLTQMQSHATIPSFASNKSSSATTYTLKYNQAADNYSLTLTDTNNTLSDIKFSASGITVSRSGNKYIKYSKLARNVYSRYTDQVEPYGMDECWLDISGTEHIYGSPERVANEIRETIKFELGLTISVGVSFNKIFAKLGSDMKKPDAITVIEKDTFRDKIWGLPAADLLGVGRATQRVLDSYCIRTIGDLANTEPDFLKRRLGKNGVALYETFRP